MRKVTTIFTAAALAAFTLPGTALGQDAGTDEYVEQLPGAGGGKPSSGGNGGGEDPTGGGPLTPAQVTALEDQGADGAAAAALAQGTGPDRNGSEGGGTNAGETASPSADDGSGIAEVVGDLTSGDDSGMGIALPLIIAAVLIGAVAFVIVRRGGGHTGRA